MKRLVAGRRGGGGQRARGTPANRAMRLPSHLARYEEIFLLVREQSWDLPGFSQRLKAQGSIDSAVEWFTRLNARFGPVS